jgi:hypothetical protein
VCVDVMSCMCVKLGDRQPSLGPRDVRKDTLVRIRKCVFFSCYGGRFVAGGRLYVAFFMW